MNEATSAFITTLAESARGFTQQLAAEEARRQVREAEEHAVSMPPLIERLRRLISAMSELERNEPHSLEWYAERLRGRQRRSPHRGELADAMRALGFVRSRSWRQTEAGFRSTWQLSKSH